MRSLLVAVVATMSLLLPAGAMAAPYSETGMPAGSHAGKHPIGWVVLVHGGAWALTGPFYVQAMRGEAARFQRLGWATLSVDYRKGTASLTDVLRFYDRLRARVGRRTPICLYGQSAGGNLALLTAEARPSVSCVISEAGPVDLSTLPNQDAYNPNTGGYDTTGPQAIKLWIALAFTPAELPIFSPISYAGQLRARTLLGTATTDPDVPLEQQDELAAARPSRVEAMTLDGGGGAPFTHTTITPAARVQWMHAQARLLAQVAHH